MRTGFLFFTLCLTLACGGTSPTGGNNAAVKPAATPSPAATQTGRVPEYTYDIVTSYPHDPMGFTQGLFFHNGFLYEGTGGQQTETKNDPFFSSVRKVEIQTGKILQKTDVDPKFFGEGIALLNGKIYQLTWRENTAFVYNLDDLKKVGEFKYSGEGWGLTEDGTDLYMSDGTHVIRVVDPETFKTKRTIVVNDERGRPMMELNELEWVNGEIWANVWNQSWILRIDPANGKLLGRIDLAKMTNEEQDQNRKADVLNGIAYDKATDRLFVTGKLWRKLFEIKIKPKQ